DRWIEIVKTAHAVGLRSTSTLMYGYIENTGHVAAHLADDAAIVYLYQGDESRVRNWLTGDDSAGEMMRDDRFRLIPAQESYLQDGYFDLQRMLGFWRTTINEFQQRRITRLLLTGEMDWATLDAPGSDRLIEYEKQLDDFLHAYPSITVVCQYALTEFPAATIFDSVCLHPAVLPAAG
ncbi:MAG: MEDS domain-containing protein, partial [Pseudomonadota bacterium]